MQRRSCRGAAARRRAHARARPAAAAPPPAPTRWRPACRRPARAGLRARAQRRGRARPRLARRSRGQCAPRRRALRGARPGSGGTPARPQARRLAGRARGAPPRRWGPAGAMPPRPPRASRPSCPTARRELSTPSPSRSAPGRSARQPAQRCCQRPARRPSSARAGSGWRAGRTRARRWVARPRNGIERTRSSNHATPTSSPHLLRAAARQAA
mmetsp:Transcript_11636/g.29481  ORF Transcript_11636/g.29481 Transcript_11636/m.29481 type:complete len:213 (-) Transcript_11636:50-688(-)